MIKIEAAQDQGYGKWEYDLKIDGQYVGLMIGTETRGGVIWEIQRWRNGNPDGSIMRLPVTTFADALYDAEMFCG